MRIKTNPVSHLSARTRFEALSVLQMNMMQMQQPMDVASLLRQMQMNMMMPSLVSPQQVRMVPNVMQEMTLQQPAQSSPVPVMPQSQAMVAPIQPNANGSLPDHGGSSNLVGQQQMAPYPQDGGSRRERRRERRRDSRSDSRSRSYRRYRRSSRHHRHRDSRPSRASRVSESEDEFNIGNINLNPTHYLTRDFAKCDNIPSCCLMIRKLPRVQLSALIESMHEPWDAALTSNLSVCGLCQLIYLMTLTVQPWTRIADLRVEFKYSKLLKRCMNAFNAVKAEQTHWNRVCTMIGNGVSLLTEESLNNCAISLGWQPTWMTETQNLNSRRTGIPATENGAIRAFVRPRHNNVEAAGIPVPQFRGAGDEGGSPSPVRRIRRRIIPPGAIVRANNSQMVPAGVINVERETESAEIAPAAAPHVPAVPAVVPPVPEAVVEEVPVPVAIEAPVGGVAQELSDRPVEAPAAVEVPAAVAVPAAVEVPAALEVPAEAVDEEVLARRPHNQDVELCAFCQCPNVADEEHGPMVKLNCIHSFHRDCLQEWMDSGDLSFEDACPTRCHLGLD